MSKPVTCPVSLNRRKALGLSIGSAIALLSSADVYATCTSWVGSTSIAAPSGGCLIWDGSLTLVNANTTISSTGTAALTARAGATALTNYGLSMGISASALENLSSTLTVENNGTIASDVVGIDNQGTIVSLNNNAGATIYGSTAGIQNSGLIMSLDNANIISGGAGILNGGMISTLTNTGTIAGTINGIQNRGNITSLSNSGTISGSSYGILADNDGQIASLENTRTGTIAGAAGIQISNQIAPGTIKIDTLTNAGQIAGTSVGIALNLNGTIGSLNNSGTITGNIAGIINAGGTLDMLINSGTIASNSYAIYNAPFSLATSTNTTGILGPITNSGLIAGTIANLTSNSLTINGGSGTTFGTLTGAGGSIGSADIGVIDNTASSVYFASGNLLLNDNIDVGSNIVQNTGATLQVNNVLHVTGNYTQTAGASLLFGVASGATTQGLNSTDSGYGRLVVSGAAEIAAGSSVGLSSLGYNFAAGQRYVVISAATTGTNYNERALNYSATGYTGVITGASVINGANNNLVLTLASPSTSGNSGRTIRATTPNAISSLGGLQRYSGTSNAALLNLYNASLAISSVSEANRVGEQLLPHQNISAASAASSATSDMINVIGNRITTVDAVSIAQSSHGESGISAGDDVTQQALWSQVFGGRTRQDMTDDISGYRADYTGVVIGYDHAISDNWLLGGAISYSYASVDGTDNVKGSGSNVKSYGLTAYAGYVAPTWYSNLYAAVLEQRYNTQRQVSFTGYNGTADGDFDGQQYALKVEFGYPIALSRTVALTPVANASYSYLYQNGYTESGGNGAALKVDSAHTDSIKSGLGAKLEITLPTRWGDVVPYAQALWSHEYNNDKMAVSAAYAGAIDETSFISRGSSPEKDAADISVGATLRGFGNTSLTAFYDLGVSPNYTNQSVSLRIRHLF